jgi:hypothetical protein
MSRHNSDSVVRKTGLEGIAFRIDDSAAVRMGRRKDQQTALFYWDGTLYCNKIPARLWLAFGRNARRKSRRFSLETSGIPAHEKSLKAN